MASEESKVELTMVPKRILFSVAPFLTHLVPEKPVGHAHEHGGATFSSLTSSRIIENKGTM